MVDGFYFVTFLMFLFTAQWCWRLSRHRSFEVTVDEDTITFRRVAGRRARPAAELTRVVDTDSDLRFTFGKHEERVFRGGEAHLLLDRVHQVKPSLRDPLNPPEFYVVLGGYDRKVVDEFMTRRREARGEPADPAPPRFPVKLRGYEKSQVDAYLGIPVPDDGY